MNRFIAKICVLLMLEASLYAGTAEVITPQGLIPKSSSEFYSISPNQPILIPVHIWGEIAQPGLYYLPKGANLSLGISNAGGPLSSADVDPIIVMRKEIEYEFSTARERARFVLKPHDTIIVERSFKADLPLVFGIISSVVSIATLIFVVQESD